jgi:hypothetical protein
MGFSAAGLLPFLGLAAIPVIIHILSRLRLRRAEFPSLMLLQAVRRERFSWLRLKELLLLIFRTLALAGLLLALARPYVKQKLPGLGRANDLILVMDDSYSMGYASHWQRAQAAASGLVKSLGPGRRGVLLTSSGASTVTEFLPARALMLILDSLQPSFADVSLGRGLKQAAELARKSRADVVAISDLQGRDVPAGWKPPADLPVTFINVGSPAFDNAGVVKLYPEELFPAPARPVRLKAELANHGGRNATRTAVLEVDGKHEEKVVAMRPHGGTTVTFETVAGDSGAHVARVELRTDSLLADNTRWFVVSFPGQIGVLVAQSKRVPARYLVDALGPDSLSALKLTVIDAAEFGRQDPRKYEVVVVTDAAALDRSDWTRLDYLIQSGGAALVMVGTVPADTVAMRKYFRVRGTVGAGGFVSIESADTTHPVFEILRQSDLGASRFFGHSRVEAPGGRVLARGTDREPLMSETADGRLIVWAFSPAPEFTDLVYKAAFVPLLHRTLYYLASAPLRSEYTVGDTIRLPVEATGPVTVVTPEGRFSVMPVSSLGRPEVVFTDTRVPGAYLVGSQPVAVNVEPDQGDLTQSPVQRLRDAGYDVRTGSGAATADLVPLMLCLTAIAFAVEMLLLAI